MSTDTPAAAPTAERRDSVIRFALIRFIAASYERANAAAQDKEGRWYKPGAAEAFLRDAKDAEAIRAALSAPVAAQPAASGVELAMEACRLLCAVAVVQESPDKVVCPQAFVPAVRAAMLALRTHMPAASGVNAQKVEQAMTKLSGAVSELSSDNGWREAYDALCFIRTHLSTALTGAAKD